MDNFLDKNILLWQRESIQLKTFHKSQFILETISILSYIETTSKD
jgi:hypothetical protein